MKPTQLRNRLPTCLRCRRLLVGILGFTAIGQASVDALSAPVVPRAKYAANAGAVGGVKVSRKPRGGYLFPLPKDGQLPQSVLPFQIEVEGPRAPRERRVRRGRRAIPGPGRAGRADGAVGAGGAARSAGAAGAGRSGGAAGSGDQNPHIVSFETDLNGNDSKSASVACPSDERMISGGAAVTPENSGRAFVARSAPFISGDNQGWSATAAEVRAQAETEPDVTTVDEPDSFDWSLSVYALCAKVN